ncbi:XdhC family protein [Anaerolineae bacterium CFX9]|nr:XdhC family protein [Anaerolineae bacterium CFX9]
MDDIRAVYEALIKAQDAGEPAALITVIEVSGSVPRHEGSKLLVRADGSIVGTIGGGKMESVAIEEALRVIADGSARRATYHLNDIAAGDPGICGGTVTIFIEPVSLPPTLLVIGMGHVGRALAELGKWAGFRVIVNDDREAYCNPAYIPDMDGYVVCEPGDVPAHVTIDGRTYVAAVTRGLPVDVRLLPALLQTPAAYIGLIGSRRRWALTARSLQQDHGISARELGRIHAPIGLELNAETPKEIAVSIIAEIVMLRRGGTGKPMRMSGEIEEENVAG